jgi:hypothetical protein
VAGSESGTFKSSNECCSFQPSGKRASSKVSIDHNWRGGNGSRVTIPSRDVTWNVCMIMNDADTRLKLNDMVRVVYACNLRQGIKGSGRRAEILQTLRRERRSKYGTDVLVNGQLA